MLLPFCLCRLPLRASRSCLLLTPPCRSAWLSSGNAAQRSEQQQHVSWQTCEQPAAAVAALQMQRQLLLLLLLLLLRHEQPALVQVALLACRGSADCPYQANMTALAAAK
jgi:hypothetical protein